MNKFYKLFNDKAKLYATSRPGYSAHVLEYLKKDLEFTSAVKGADIGCGTGQLTQILAQYFNFIYAIEPNSYMMEECKKYIHYYKNNISLGVCLSPLPPSLFLVFCWFFLF